MATRKKEEEELKPQVTSPQGLSEVPGVNNAAAPTSGDKESAVRPGALENKPYDGPPITRADTQLPLENKPYEGPEGRDAIQFRGSNPSTEADIAKSREASAQRMRDRIAELDKRAAERNQKPTYTREQLIQEGQEDSDRRSKAAAEFHADRNRRLGIKDEPLDAGEMGPTSPQEMEERRESRRFQKETEKGRAAKLRTERERARRGLPPLPGNEEARRAVQGGPEGMRSFREQPAPDPMGLASPQAGPTPAGAPQGLAQDALEAQAAAGAQPSIPGQEAATGVPGEFQTGQVVNIEALPGGQTSTAVYSMPGGIVLPDGQGMTEADYQSAFKQLNPGKNIIDGIQALAREPGRAGERAREAMKNAGAVAGTPLTPEQQGAIITDLQGQMTETLIAHSLGMGRQIQSGAAAIEGSKRAQQEAEEEEEKQRRDDRKEALAAFEKRRGDEGDIQAQTMSDQQIINEEMERIAQRRRFIEEGVGFEGEAPDVTSVSEIGEFYEANPKVIPLDAMQEGVSRIEGGRLEYRTRSLGARKLPAIMIDRAFDDGKIVVPVVPDKKTARQLPPGVGYVMNGKYYERGTPGRPSKDGKAEPQTRAEREAEGRPDYDRSAIRKELEQKSQAQTKEQLEPIQEEVAYAQQKVANANADLRRAQDQGIEGVTLFPFQEAARAAQNELKTTQGKLSAAQERIGVDLDISQEDISAEIASREDQRLEDMRFGEEDAYRRGDPEAVARALQDALPENAQIVSTAEGEQMLVGDVGVPVYRDTNGQPVIIGVNVKQAVALEANARGFIPVGVTGGDVEDAAFYTLDQRDLYQGLTDAAKKDPMFFDNASEEEQKRFYTELLQPYVNSKYSREGLTSQEMREVENAVLESLFGGFYR